MDHAYCIQLKRNVTIGEIRNEYFSQEIPRKRYDFLCSDKNCIQKDGTRTEIVGVCYDRLPVDTENETFRVPYFRLKQNIHHNEKCIWATAKKETGEPIRGHHEKIRRETPKQNLIIDTFHINEVGKLSSTAANHVRHNEDNNQNTNTDRPHNNYESNDGRHRKNHSSTRLLDDLVYSYLEAKEVLNKEEFLHLPLHITGMGQIFFYQFFSHLTNFQEGSLKVYYAGCYFKKIYPTGKTLDEITNRFGFSLSFFDFFDTEREIEFNCYVSPDEMEVYRYRKTFKELIVRQEEYDYLMAYFLTPELSKNSKGNMDIIIKNPAHLCLIPRKRAPKNNDQNS